MTDPESFSLHLMNDDGITFVRVADVITLLKAPAVNTATPADVGNTIQESLYEIAMKNAEIPGRIVPLKPPKGFLAKLKVCYWVIKGETIMYDTDA